MGGGKVTPTPRLGLNFEKQKAVNDTVKKIINWTTKNPERIKNVLWTVI